MITPSALRRLATMQGVSPDAEVFFSLPSAATNWAHEIRICKGSLLVCKPFIFGAPSLGDLARMLADLVKDHEWVRA